MTSSNTQSPFNDFSQQHQQKIEELVAIAKEQGYITYEEINDVLPMSFDTADQNRPGIDFLKWYGHPYS